MRPGTSGRLRPLLDVWCRPLYAAAIQALVTFAIGLTTATASFADRTPNVYFKEAQYAGCLFGDTVPLLRKGYARNRALSIASWKCEPLSKGFSERQIHEISDYVNASIDELESQQGSAASPRGSAPRDPGARER